MRSYLPAICANMSRTRSLDLSTPQEVLIVEFIVLPWMPRPLLADGRWIQKGWYRAELGQVDSLTETHGDFVVVSVPTWISRALTDEPQSFVRTVFKPIFGR